MKKMISLFAVVFTCSTYAQEVSIKWSDPTKDEYEYYSFVRGSGNDMIKLSLAPTKMFHMIKTRPMLSRYNDQLKLEAEHEYDLGERQTSLDDVIFLSGNLFMLTHLYEKSQDATTYYSQAINYNTLVAKGSPVAIASFDAIRKSKQSSIEYRTSLDTSKLLLFSTVAYDRKSNLKYYFSVFDKNMKKIWEKTVELPILDKYVDITDIAITNDGKVAVIVKHYDQDITKEKVKEDGANVPSYKTKLFVYDSRSDKPQEYLVDLGNKFVQSLSITDDSESGLDLFGLYKNKYNGYVNGYFTCNLDSKTMQVNTKIIAAFPDDFVSLVSKDRFGSDKEKDPGISGSFKLKWKLDRNGYGTDYLLEYFKIIEHTSYNSSTHTSTTYYEYVKGDIVDIFIDVSGKTVVTRIPKYQHAGTTLYEGFATLPYKDKLLLFYNDDRDNLDQDINKRPDDVRKFSKSILMMTSIGLKGEINRKMVVDNKEEDLTSCPGLSSILDDSRIMIYSRKGLGVFGSAREYVGMMEIK